MSTLVVLVGGGLKGAVAAGRYAADHDLVLVHLDYGQAAARIEAGAVRSLAAALPHAEAVSLEVGHIKQLQHARDGEEEQHDASGSTVLSPTVLRGLMPVMLSVGVQCAVRYAAPKVVTGLSRRCDATHLGLPTESAHLDQRREFLHAYQIAIETLAMQRGGPQIEAPLIDLTYAEIIKLGERLRIPLEMAWSCERPTAPPCGKCTGCVTRRDAFSAASVVDPLLAPATE